MSNIDIRKLVLKVKEKKGLRKVRTSFALDSQIYASFLEVCHKQGVSAASVVEQFMQDFVTQIGGKK